MGVEAEALRRLCAAELRRPRDQARHILRTELERRGLLRCVCTVIPIEDSPTLDDIEHLCYKEAAKIANEGVILEQKGAPWICGVGSERTTVRVVGWTNDDAF